MKAELASSDEMSGYVDVEDAFSVALERALELIIALPEGYEEDAAVSEKAIKHRLSTRELAEKFAK
ncbi:hypothetical protein FWF74_02120 [Candidatus Saccharibacteria bacterium]|nr:hypothetical protein [Candidatus Saccharibacteria bacterium]MCL1963247.1 hypothetical protein [Candidatus Saccharibacteria bacterium]